MTVSFGFRTMKWKFENNFDVQFVWNDNSWLWKGKNMIGKIIAKIKWLPLFPVFLAAFKVLLHQLKQSQTATTLQIWVSLQTLLLLVRQVSRDLLSALWLAAGVNMLQTEAQSDNENITHLNPWEATSFFEFCNKYFERNQNFNCFNWI